jgi:hypothetical protein
MSDEQSLKDRVEALESVVRAIFKNLPDDLQTVIKEENSSAGFLE